MANEAGDGRAAPDPGRVEGDALPVRASASWSAASGVPGADLDGHVARVVGDDAGT